jgi:HK97 family phage prohead protease
MAKRVIVSNETPNDQGSIVLNSSIDTSRFKLNPVMLYNHDWETPIGRWENLTFDGRNWTAEPVFSNIDSVREYKTLWEEGNLKAASIGGAVIYKTDKMDNIVMDENGNRTVTKFTLYEISLVPIPSNKDAVTLSARFYEDEEILVLNSKIMAKKETEKIETPEIPVENASEKPVETTEQPAIEKPQEPQPTHVILKGFFQNFIDEIKALLVSSHDEPDGDEAVQTRDLPQSEQPEGAVEAAANLEAQALEKVKNCNNCSELEAMEAEANLPDVVKKAIETRKSELKAKEEPKKEEKTQNNSFKKMETPELKEKTELAGQIVEPPKKQIITMGAGKSLTELRATKDGREMIERLAAGGSNDINERIVFVQALLADRKYNAVVDKIRFVTNASADMINDYRKSVKPTGNTTLESLLNKTRENLVKLGSSADALTTPETTAIEWLSLVLFKLFPSTEWKAEIPLFGAEEAGNNLGLIWTNIAADPAVYKGAKPSPADYEYSDTAVSLKMVNYWLQPMLWTPLAMHLLRYDQMATGWDQGLMKLRSEIDGDLIYTLASLVPAASILFSSGTPFNLAAATDIDQFLLNTAFVGSLARPKLDDTLRLQQLYTKQNFQDGTKHVLVMDPTCERYITSDPDTKSLLTRFVNSSGDELVGYKNVMFRSRSKVALYDKATGNIVDPSGVIPATSVGANLSFIPSQVGMGLGKFDVFMIQDPSKYGYKMSCDLRMGIQPLRANFNGVALLTYGDPVI